MNEKGRKEKIMLDSYRLKVNLYFFAYVAQNAIHFGGGGGDNSHYENIFVRIQTYWKRETGQKIEHIFPCIIGSNILKEGETI